MHIVHMAAENDSLPNAKVGGVADVVRDIAPALADLGHQVSVVTPGYGFLHETNGAEHVANICFPFRGTLHDAQLYRVPAKHAHPGVTQYVIHHPVLESVDTRTGQHQIYVHDPDDQPFFSDGSRFACFCSAAAAALVQQVIPRADVMHLHDWHMALVALLRRYHPACAPLQNLRTVFTIHNLALQGVRPLAGSSSSLSAWFPDITWHWLDVADPRWPDTCNLMACGIRLSDRVHTVSPTYAKEICQPDDLPRFHGAQGLHAVLAHENDTGNLKGILNGCEYPEDRHPPVMETPEMLRGFQRRIMQWSAGRQTVSSAAFIACHNLSELLQRRNRPRPDRSPMVLCSVTRLTGQKVLLMRQGEDNGMSAIARILTALGDDGVYFLLGTGHEEFVRFFTQLGARFPNFIFLHGFSDQVAQALYANGDLFLMPSSFEPCGIGQMLAMRDGQPCVVHAVGGLRDTVVHGGNGFSFGGGDLDDQAQNFVETASQAIELFKNDPDKWQQIKTNAAAARFLWQHAAQQYVEKLYG